MSEIGIRRYQTRLMRYFLNTGSGRDERQRLVRCQRREQAIERVAVMEGERGDARISAAVSGLMFGLAP